jgi:hypothetical protein
MWQVKQPPLLKPISVNHRSKFAFLSSVIMKAAAKLNNSLRGCKQTNSVLHAKLSIRFIEYNVFQFISTVLHENDVRKDL